VATPDPAPSPERDAALAALRRLGAAHRTDAERVPLARARGRVLSEAVDAGIVTFAAGHRLSPADLGALAAAGFAELPCARRPTVALFTAGDGLRAAGLPLGEGERFDACRAVLVGLLQEAGLEPVAWPILPGDPARARGALEDAAQAFDLVLSCDPIDASGRPRLAALFGSDAVPEPLDLPRLQAVGGAFGHRAPQALWLALPEDRERLSREWPLVQALLDAMQGLREPLVAAAESAAGLLEIAVGESDARRAAGARLVDVREPEEQALGLPPGAELLPLSRLEREPAAYVDDGRPVLLLCASGRRSLRAVGLLRDRGVAEAFSLRGGLAAWREAGLPVEVPAAASTGLDAEALQRYDRHLRLAAVGPEGQQRLLAARVVIVGAGGLGSPAAFYLAAAGVGRITLVDDDRIERSNLQRQILHVDAAVGRPKVESARERLLALNPSIRIEAIDARIDAGNVDAVLRGADVVIDGSDDFATRFLVDGACLRLGLPLVYGAVERFTGQVSVFDAGRQRGRAPCYRCLFPEAPGADAAPNCAEAGVLGVLPGLVGLLQATEALKLILGIGEPLVGRVLMVDALAMRFRTLVLPVDPSCPGCGR
jgi:molybdopterin/thiamine biosynthesis adenylyltransferase/rhodanese-related sulfurtransferase